MNDRILYEDENFFISSSAPCDTDTVVIAFANRGHFSGDNRRLMLGWGESFFLKNSISFISIVDKNNGWYQNFSQGIVDFIWAILRDRFSGATKIISYGSSMGAYAAIKYAGLLGADHVLSLSPPSRIKAHPIWCADCQKEISPVVAVDVKGLQSVNIAFDPLLIDPKFDRTLDAVYASEIFSNINSVVKVRMLPFKHFAHPTATVLAETGLLKTMLLELITCGEIKTTRPSTKRLLNNRKYVKFRLRNLINRGMFLSAARFVYVTRFHWLDSSTRPKLAIDVLKRTGRYPQLLVLMEYSDLFRDLP